MISVLLSGRFSGKPRSGGTGGCMLPSYQTHFSAGRLPRALKWYVTTEAVGALMAVGFAAVASTAFGAGRSKAQNPPSIMWQPMSPSAPVPKSQNPRQLKGRYAGSYSRGAATPSHRSQSSVLGTTGMSLL